MKEKIEIIVKSGTTTITIYAQKGSNLRQVLLNHQIEPFNSIFSDNDHCEGTGLCAECGVWIENVGQNNALNQQSGIAKLSCEFIVIEPITIDLDDQWIADFNKKNIRRSSS